ncbi:ABC transporter permease [Saccharomonospora glauca]|jgi:ABC-2 type transport system permease protein|uniref:ABC-type multidrug transport system, permease component n=1 Tax=Saccharomonospora glauca K62 TaxID=928724 RepID=I1D0S2_9PSEU|nr:ABC transporter permease [Saccharomonospora glauca]EIE98546.1 ABC-type multidrug transport system, permease component [Saccharomonospora glauca K62]
MNLTRRQLVALFRAETKLLTRNSTVAATALVFPVAMAVFMVLYSRDNLGALGWALPVALQVLLIVGMTVYISTTLALTARREDLYLKRLRSGEASDVVIIVGISSPLIVLGLLQCVLAVAVVWVLGQGRPHNVPVLALAVVLSVAMTATLGFATTGLVSSTQQADMAGLPFFLFLLVTGIWGATNGAEGPTVEQLWTPGGAVVDLMRIAYDGTSSFSEQLAASPPAVLVLLAWTVVGAVAARRLFRWDRRVG